jgi:hypothetical protein
MSKKQEETPVAENRVPLELTSKPEEVFEITGKELAAFFQAQKLFFEFSNLFKHGFVQTLEAFKEKQISLGKLRYIYPEDIREVIKEDGTKVKELREDFFEDTSTQTS